MLLGILLRKGMMLLPMEYTKVKDKLPRTIEICYNSKDSVKQTDRAVSAKLVNMIVYYSTYIKLLSSKLLKKLCQRQIVLIPK